MVMLETLRIQNPANNGMPIWLLRDCQIGDFNIRAYDELIVNYQAIQMNPNEWKRPREFLPQRFNSEDPLSLAPSERKRHSHAFVPFSGGKRVCFGKSFPEATMKMTMAYFVQYFNFELMDEHFKDQKDLYPQAHFGVSCQGA